MCGIAGIVNYGGAAVAPPVLQAMTDAIAHRGPDGEGHWIEEGVGFGHRRLAIIDLAQQASPRTDGGLEHHGVAQFFDGFQRAFGGERHQRAR